MLRRSFVSFLLATPAFAVARPTSLAREGEPLLAIITGAAASPRVRQAATDLADVLGKMTAGRFNIAAGDGAGAGILVGLPSDFPALGFAAKWAHADVSQREEYLISTHDRGAILLGATDQAVEYAVWDFLHRLGYRQFFPGERWECIPRLTDLSCEMQVTGSPSYRFRDIWYEYGAADYAAKPHQQWKQRNRIGGALDLRMAHSYGGIIRGLRAEFDQHPEFYPLIDGQRRPSKGKLCIGNAQLRQLIVQYQLERLRVNPSLDSISMEPSDGGGWCECSLCAALGSISDRVVVLANEVAAAISREYPQKLVGMLAYNFHSPPPSVRVHPSVVVSVATEFIRGGLTADEVMDGWAKQGATLGVYDYYSVHAWDRDLPGHARGGDTKYLARTIPAYHAKGARFLTAESSDNWGPNGLGYYLASRLLWDVQEARSIDLLIEDFVARAFGPASAPMRQFYRQLDTGGTSRVMSRSQLARMFRCLAAARKLAARDSAVLARLNDLVLYAHYCSLYDRYATAARAQRQSAFEALIRHAYRMRTTMMVNTKALYLDLATLDKSVSIPSEAAWNVPEPRNPWKSSLPFRDEEIAAAVDDGIHRYPAQAIAFSRVEFSADLRPADALRLASAEPGSLGPGRGAQQFFVFVGQGRKQIEVTIAGGLGAIYRDRGTIQVGLRKVVAAGAPERAERLVVLDRSVSPDGNEHTLRLQAPTEGLYRLTLGDGMGRTEVRFASDMPVVVPSTPDLPMNRFYEEWTAYFYVPKGTRTVGLQGGTHGEVQDSQGRTVFWLNGRQPEVYAIDVPEGEEGKAWRIRFGHGEVRLLTVPPYFAPTPRQLLVPAEVLHRDS
jgi:hypothetical protein